MDNISVNVHESLIKIVCRIMSTYINRRAHNVQLNHQVINNGFHIEGILIYKGIMHGNYEKERNTQMKWKFYPAYGAYHWSVESQQTTINLLQIFTRILLAVY